MLEWLHLLTEGDQLHLPAHSKKSTAGRICPSVFRFWSAAAREARMAEPTEAIMQAPAATAAPLHQIECIELKGAERRKAAADTGQKCKCAHSGVIDFEHRPDHVRLSDLEPKFTCQADGHPGAHVRPLFEQARMGWPPWSNVTFLLPSSPRHLRSPRA